MGAVRGRDDEHVHVLEQRVELGHHTHLRVRGPRVRGALARAGQHGHEREPVDRLDQRRVEDRAGEPVAREPDPQPHEPSVLGR